MELTALVERARGGELDAFTELTHRFQHMAFGYALAHVSRDETVRVCADVLAGAYDDVPEQAFYFKGTSRAASTRCWRAGRLQAWKPGMPTPTYEETAGA